VPFRLAQVLERVAHVSFARARRKRFVEVFLDLLHELVALRAGKRSGLGS